MVLFSIQLVGYFIFSPSSGKGPSDVVVSAAVTELAFPSTKVGTVTSQKIPLQNWSGDKQEVFEFRSFEMFLFPDSCVMHRRTNYFFFSERFE